MGQNYNLGGHVCWWKSNGFGNAGAQNLHTMQEVGRSSDCDSSNCHIHSYSLFHNEFRHSTIQITVQCWRMNDRSHLCQGSAEISREMFFKTCQRSQDSPWSSSSTRGSVREFLGNTRLMNGAAHPKDVGAICSLSETVQTNRLNNTSNPTRIKKLQGLMQILPTNRENPLNRWPERGQKYLRLGTALRGLSALTLKEAAEGPTIKHQ